MLPVVIARGHLEACIIGDDQTGSLRWPTDLCLPCLLVTAVHLETIVAEHGVSSRGHVGGGGRGGIHCQTIIIAHILLTHAHGAVETVAKDAVLPNLDTTCYDPTLNSVIQPHSL